MRESTKNVVVDARNSFASIHEVQSLYRILETNSVGLLFSEEFPRKGNVSPFQLIQRQLREVTGDIKVLYGLANPEDINESRQRKLPMNCSFYDLVRFAKTIAKNNASPDLSVILKEWVKEAWRDERDLLNSMKNHKSFIDFFVSD